VGTFVIVQNKSEMGLAHVCQTPPTTSYRSCLGMEYYPFRGSLPLEWRYNRVNL